MNPEKFVIVRKDSQPAQYFAGNRSWTTDLGSARQYQTRIVASSVCSRYNKPAGRIVAQYCTVEDILTEQKIAQELAEAEAAKAKPAAKAAQPKAKILRRYTLPHSGSQFIRFGIIDQAGAVVFEFDIKIRQGRRGSTFSVAEAKAQFLGLYATVQANKAAQAAQEPAHA